MVFRPQKPPLTRGETSLEIRRNSLANHRLSCASFGAGKGRHKACPYRELTGLKERSVTSPSWAGTCYEWRHQVGEACCRRGGVAGAEPPHKGGPNRPDRPDLQWFVVSGQRRRVSCLRTLDERDMTLLRPEVWESSPPFWDAPVGRTIDRYIRLRYIVPTVDPRGALIVVRQPGSSSQLQFKSSAVDQCVNGLCTTDFSAPP